ncbi:hypothetical protein RIR_jg10504.t2 [Rhizophagus irregularis DAOM 181602=DAOM 197198]|nr:hypothetical protein RIR_jg10504.t2 [Rhizophagus irregularis DAOM 181602=DAOM 197198]
MRNCKTVKTCKTEYSWLKTTSKLVKTETYKKICKWFFLKYRAVILNLNNETTPGLRLRLGNLMKGTTSLRLLVSLTRERVFFGCDISSTSKFPRHEFSVCSSGLNMLDLMVGPLVWNIGDQIIGCVDFNWY